MRVCDLSLAKWIVPYCLFLFSCFIFLFLLLPSSFTLPLPPLCACGVPLSVVHRLFFILFFNLFYLSSVYVSLFSELMLIKCSYVTNKKKTKDHPDRCVKSSRGRDVVRRTMLLHDVDLGFSGNCSFFSRGNTHSCSLLVPSLSLK